MISSSTHSPPLLAAITFLAVLVASGPSNADELQLDAKSLFRESTTRNLRLTADGSAIELATGELIEDDGPAAGYSYLPNEEKLSDIVRIRKELIIPKLGARKATLLVASGGDLKGTINGQVVELKNPVKTAQYWQAYEIPTNILKAGKNEIVLWGAGKVWIARAEDFAKGSIERAKHPGRSARSGDSGKTWEVDKLGPTSTISGEYNVRLLLEQYLPGGSLTTRVYDAANLSGKTIAPAFTGNIPVTTHRTEERGRAGENRLFIRTGKTRVPSADTWSDWREYKFGDPTDEPRGRFFQARIEWSLSTPLDSPRLQTLRFESKAKIPVEGWSKKLSIDEFQNAHIVRSSIQFVYEPFDHPRLKEYRSTQKLDEVVSGARDELQLISALAKWSATRWEKGHLKDIYPSWDALDILKPHADGKPIGGFCQQYNLVFLQACESFGIPGRAVSIGGGDHSNRIKGGHEVVELWSNQFKKWIYVDGNMAWYAVDEKTGTPHSLLELRDRQAKALKDEEAPATKFVELLEGGKRWTSLLEWPTFQEMRMIPRSNFLAEKAPLPLNQGMRGWFWTGHHVWTDEDAPAALIYGQRVAERNNWNWTLNQAHLTLEASTTEGALHIHVDTETPGFDTFLASIDGGEFKPVAADFTWKLKPGKNRLEVRPRNIAGRDGISSVVVVEQK